MKKALKTIFIVILCLAAAAGTGYLFFANLTKSVSAFESVNNFYYSVEQHEIYININKVQTHNNERFAKLNRVFTDLKTSAFYVNANLLNVKSTSVGNVVNEKLSALESETDQIQVMVSEYLLKVNASGFNEVAGADDLYVAYAKYLMHYAAFVQYLNQIAIQNAKTADVDIRFAVTDVYMNIIQTNFAEINADGSSDLQALDYMWHHYYLYYGYVSTRNPNGDFAIENNKFIEHYNKCDKQSFAKNFVVNLNSATSDAETDELLAAYYFKIIMGE